MNNEETLFDVGQIKNERNNEPKVQGKKNHNALKITAATVGGAALGAGATFASQASAAEANDAAKASATPEVSDATSSTPQVAIVDEAQDFTTAFNEARDEVGAGGVFVYHGTLYNTYTEDEWNGMSQEEKDSFAQKVQPEAQKVEANYQAEVQAIHNSQSEEQVEVEGVKTNDDAMSSQAINYEQQTDLEEQTDESEVHVLTVEHNVDMNGETVDVAAIEVNGRQGLLIDVNQDGTADVAAVDINGNGQLDQGEVGDICAANVQMPEQTPGDQYMASADDLPDYMNDASFV